MKPEIIRVTKSFTFDMAHALHGHDGPCKNIHGHTYHLYVTIIGKALQQEGHPKNGMLVDFGDLKQLIQKSIIDIFDHALVLNANAVSPEEINALKKSYVRVIGVDYQPSCENLIIDIKNKLQGVFNGQSFTLYSLKLNETPTSYAEWFSTDNIHKEQ